ncbi:hypothetical protein ACWD25_38380 [Streptomyces sp. NPDC002920]
MGDRHAVRPDRLVSIAVQAAERQRTSLPGVKPAAELVHTLAEEVVRSRVPAATTNVRTRRRCAVVLAGRSGAVVRWVRARRMTCRAWASLRWKISE